MDELTILPTLMPLERKKAYTKDGFKNVLKGLGTVKDAREYTTFQQGFRITQTIANYLYVYNWLAAKVVDIPVDDATRKWRTLLIPDAERKKEIEDAMLFFDVKAKLNLAMKWARVFGGSVIIAIVEGQDPEMPLDVETIKQDALKNLIVLDRYNIYPSHVNRDILSGNFGQPEYYTVARAGQKVHRTRLLKLEGVKTTLREYEQENYWGNSIYTKGWEPIGDSQTVSQSISNLVYEANVDVYRINGFNALVAEGNDDLVVKRLKIAHEMKSIINGIALDKEDEYDKKQNSFMQLPNIDDRFMQKVAGAYNIPMTKLVGISPAGQNATGESDMLNYYDRIQSLQDNEIRPYLDWLDKIVIKSAFGADVDFAYEFKPLKQLTEIEKAEVDLKNAQRDQIYIDLDVIRTTDSLAEIAENGTYVTIDENRVEEELKLEELDLLEEEENDDDDLLNQTPVVVIDPDEDDNDGNNNNAT